MSFTTSIEDLRQPAVPAAVETLFVRNAGLDTNPGTLAAPLLTVQEAFSRLKRNPGAPLRQIIDITGFTNVIAAPLIVDAVSAPFKNTQWISEADRPGGTAGGKFDVFDYPVELRADPTLVLNLTGISSATEPTTGNKVLTVNEILVVDAHVGQYVQDPDKPDSGGLIDSNTTSTITIAGTTSYAGNGAIFKHGGNLDFTGASGGFFKLDVAPKCPFVMSGIDVIAGAVAFKPIYNIYSVFCNFQGGLFCGDGAARVDVQTSTIGFLFQQIGAPVALRYDIFRSNVVILAGNGGDCDIRACILDTCAPISTISAYNTVRVEESIIRDGTGNGIECASPGGLEVIDTIIDDCAGDAITVSGNNHVVLDNVVGTGNTGVGVRLNDGTQAKVVAVPSVTGTSGDVKVGGNTVTTWATARPQTDVGATDPEFCRLF